MPVANPTGPGACEHEWRGAAPCVECAKCGLGKYSPTHAIELQAQLAAARAEAEELKRDLSMMVTLHKVARAETAEAVAKARREAMVAAWRWLVDAAGLDEAGEMVVECVKAMGLPLSEADAVFALASSVATTPAAAPAAPVNEDSMQCRRCGREATHVQYDGYDSDMTCAEYPNCKGDPARDPLGAKVRAIWIQWAHQQPVAKPHWLTPYEELDEPDKEVDRRIGERLYAMGRDSAPVNEAAERWPEAVVELARCAHESSDAFRQNGGRIRYGQWARLADAVDALPASLLAAARERGGKL